MDKTDIIGYTTINKKESRGNQYGKHKENRHPLIRRILHGDKLYL